MDEMDRMIDLVVSDAQLAHGCPPEWLQARGMVARPVEIRSARRPQPWTEKEDQFYLENVGKLSYEAIAEALGRTVAAVRIHAKRHGLPAATRVPGILTGNQVANLLGVDSHKPPVWIDAGVMPGGRLPGAPRPIRIVSLLQLKMWMIRPTSWVYFRVERIKNPSLRRLVELAQAKWGDEWLTTAQVSLMFECDTRVILRQIQIGKLPGYHPKVLGGRHLEARWAFWFVKRSDIANLVIPKGKGGNGYDRKKWSSRADEFILRAVGEGRSYCDIARMMKWPAVRAKYRAQVLLGIK